MIMYMNNLLPLLGSQILTLKEGSERYIFREPLKQRI